jgi:hypothetical protein
MVAMDLAHKTCAIAGKITAASTASTDFRVTETLIHPAITRHLF